jgi:hypothetical protein
MSGCDLGSIPGQCGAQLEISFQWDEEIQSQNQDKRKEAPQSYSTDPPNDAYGSNSAGNIEPAVAHPLSLDALPLHNKFLTHYEPPNRCSNSQALPLRFDGERDSTDDAKSFEL